MNLHALSSLQNEDSLHGDPAHKSRMSYTKSPARGLQLIDVKRFRDHLFETVQSFQSLFLMQCLHTAVSAFSLIPNEKTMKTAMLLLKL